MGLENIGFCESSQSKEFVKGGAIALGRWLPVTTNAGPFSARDTFTGMNLLTEAVRQVRGIAVNQVERVELVRMSSESTHGLWRRGPGKSLVTR
jgi:acetyl-CoA acetyltransferase